MWYIPSVPWYTDFHGTQHAKHLLGQFHGSVYPVGRLKEAEKSYKLLEAKSGTAMRELVKSVERNSEALAQGHLQVQHSTIKVQAHGSDLYLSCFMFVAVHNNHISFHDQVPESNKLQWVEQVLEGAQATFNRYVFLNTLLKFKNFKSVRITISKAPYFDLVLA